MSTEQTTEEATQALAGPFDPLRHNIRWDQGDVTRVPNPDRAGVIRFTPADSAQTSREALGVWRRNTQAFKLFGTLNQFTRVTTDINTAITNNLPHAGASTAQGLVYTYENPTFRTLQGFAVIATWYDQPWRFFSGQGNWQPGFRAIINGATHNALLGIQRALRIAVQLRLSDPQGFINPTTQATNSIQFIDIHYGSAVIAQQMLDIVNEQL
ncbi:hypothetical protein K435DRAFT_967719 [Dendrothele bispora CBS 962.96]|uniref:Uncharacterized protein n=1 Tax=Dendrothele bispora (strain CBS 962.96) TaxID=1314807 RepID=A0A4S8LS67_DENBC|nr:hypothetical protein K435DRAFT_967719 [Dendrothele bispora CBS 962.96]